MQRITLKRTGDVIRKVFEILLAQPEGLPDRVVLENIRRSFLLADVDRLAEEPSSILQAFERVTYLGTIAPVKAGWLVNQNSRWSVTDEGRLAYDRFRDPEQFMLEAGRLSRKGWLCIHFPMIYWLACRAKYQMTIEYRLVRRLGLRYLFGRAIEAVVSWHNVLPLQAPLRVVIPDLALKDFRDLIAHIKAAGAPFGEGGHTVYLPPESLRSTAFRVLADRYPEGVGLKIMKNPGGVDGANYIHGANRRISVIHRKLAYQHRVLTLVANLLYSHDVGPRLYDLIELQCGDQLWTAYVIEHVKGRVPSMAECNFGLARIRDLDLSGLIKINLPDGYDDEEFQCPCCNDNALVDQQGSFRYIDFQNFLLVDYGSFLERLAGTAAESSHFGDQSLMRGGRYLYQAVPGVNRAGRRSPAQRLTVIQGLMESAGVSLNDRLVLDLGCNLGMMMAQYLSAGARWCHGWDRPQIIPHTEKLMLALGCTRFSVTAGELSASHEIEADLPGFLTPYLDGCVISYLAVHGHLGWLEALGRIDWSFLLYEGHEDDTLESVDAALSELGKSVAFRIAAVTLYNDGDSDSRPLALLVRTPA